MITPWCAKTLYLDATTYYFSIQSTTTVQFRFCCQISEEKWPTKFHYFSWTLKQLMNGRGKVWTWPARFMAGIILVHCASMGVGGEGRQSWGSTICFWGHGPGCWMPKQRLVNARDFSIPRPAYVTLPYTAVSGTVEVGTRLKVYRKDPRLALKKEEKNASPCVPCKNDRTIMENYGWLPCCHVLLEALNLWLQTRNDFGGCHFEGQPEENTPESPASCQNSYSSHHQPPTPYFALRRAIRGGSF